MITLIQMLIGYIVNFPKATFFWIKDVIDYIKTKRWLLFEGWGLHIFVGMFGASKTSSLVEHAYRLAKTYPDLNILTNFELLNFPNPDKIKHLNTFDDIINCDDGTLVLIDEISSLFNSRDFGKGQAGVSKPALQVLLQCRKRRVMIMATAQRYLHVDKQLRDITATVRVCSAFFAHPFTRMCTVRTFDGMQYEKALSNDNAPLQCLGVNVYVQTDKLRNSYDTLELVNHYVKAEYLSDSEILSNRIGTGDVYVNAGGKAKKRQRMT